MAAVSEEARHGISGLSNMPGLCANKQAGLFSSYNQNLLKNNKKKSPMWELSLPQASFHSLYRWPADEVF